MADKRAQKERRRRQLKAALKEREPLKATEREQRQRDRKESGKSHQRHLPRR
jgi:hypothetical protein